MATTEISEENGTIELYLNDVIALCYILDGFEAFSEDIKRFLDNDKYNDLNILSNLANGKNVLSTIKAKMVKKFYDDNKPMIDIINNFSGIKNFINRNFIVGYQQRIMIMYNYILKNRSQLSKIIAVLDKLKDLGFNTIKFNESMNFDNHIYHYFQDSPQLGAYYLDGDIYVYPNYDVNDFKYKTTGANYLMELNVFPNSLSTYGMVITLNNLVFDVSNLPKGLTFYETMGKLLELKKENESIDEFIRSSVQLDYHLDKINDAINIIDVIMADISNVEDKDKVLEVIAQVKSVINELSAFISDYESRELKENDISKELLEQEKSLYKRNREYSKIH